MATRILEGADARSLPREEKWKLLSRFLKEHGTQSLAYATLQEGMEYFIDDCGYIAYTSIYHPVFARRTKKIALSDPVCAPENYATIVERFVRHHPSAVFAVISEKFAEVLRSLRFKVNCIGYESELPIQSYNTQGNWKELDLIKRARNEAKREGITIREEQPGSLDPKVLNDISSRWISTKKVNDREIWIYARRPIFGPEEDVRKFLAYDRDGHVAGFVFYDPMYRHGSVYGYSANISRCDEQRYGRLATAVNMHAMEIFRAEGKQTLNLLLAPFVKLDLGKFNDDFGTKLFFNLSAKFGNNIYNFKGLSFNKSKYRGTEVLMYFASNSAWPSNDVYLAFLSADIARSYFSTLGRLIWGMLTAGRNGKSN